MKSFHVYGVRRAALGCAATFLLALSAGTSEAQRGSAGATAAGRRTDTLNRQAEEYDRDQLSREKKGPAAATNDRARAEDVTRQVKRDFEALQAAYNKIVLAMARGGHPDFHSILDSVDVVKKGAVRLRSNLALPKAKKEEDKARGNASGLKMEESLLLLRKHVYSFVTNPLFEAASVLNVQQAEKAARDLDMIIELGELILRSGRSTGQHD